MKRLSWKAINTWIVFGLLLAPGLYLFGGYIGQLAGSHGQFMYAEPAIEGGVDYSVEYNGKTYQRYMYKEWGLTSYQPSSTKGLYIGFNENNQKEVLSKYPIYTESYGIDLETPSYALIWNSDNPAVSSCTLPNSCCFTWWKYRPGNENYVYYEVYFDSVSSSLVRYWIFTKNYTTGEYNEYETGTQNLPTIQYGDSLGGNMPNYTFNWTTPRNIQETQPYNQEAPAIEANAQGNTEFQQGQFFSRNNFLKKWGDSVVSEEETWGFAPFKALIQYLDENMLHFASNGVQYGLMAYGYMYYALHIVLLDIVFYITSFLPRILKKLAERLEGGLD